MTESVLNACSVIHYFFFLSRECTFRTLLSCLAALLVQGKNTKDLCIQLSPLLFYFYNRAWLVLLDVPVCFFLIYIYIYIRV